MPLVKVNLLKGRSAEEKDSIAASIQAALVSTLKVSDADRRAIENAMADLKEALKGDDADAITTKTNALAQASMKLGEAMYKQAAEQQAGGGSGGGETAGGDGKKEDVVDAEFTEVDDDKKNKKSA